MLKQFTLLTLLLVAFLGNAQVNVDPDHPNIVYWGRVDFTNPKTPAFALPGVTIRAKFTGTSLSAKIQDDALHGATTTNYFYSIIDGGTPKKLEALKGNNTYALATGLTAGSHTVELIKLTEANVGKMTFLGFVLETGAKLEPLLNEPSCHIEFIGNSITCGYGNEVSIAAPPTGNPTTGFTSINENNYKAWGYVTARKLGMKYNAVSYSGRGLYRNNDASTTGVLPSIYDRIFPDNASAPTWDHASQHPNCIVIDLGTNDFAPDPAQPLDQTAFETAYVNFVKKLKGYHPDATIILAVGVMMSDGYPVGANQWTRIRTYVKNAVNTLTTGGTLNVHYFEMEPQSAPYGEDWHPSEATHNTMATGLATFINTLGITCTASNNGLKYTIPNWLDDKKAAVSLTFDDWSPGHPAIVVPELKKRDLIATFFMSNALGIPNWSEVLVADANGNEIANHTKSHKDLTGLSGANKKVEIRDNKVDMESKLKGKKVLTFAYPFGAYNQEVIDSVRNSEHIASRGVQPSSGNYTYNFAPTENDYHKILTFGMDSNITIDQFSNQIINVSKGGGLLTYLYHSIYSGTVADNSYAQIHEKNFTRQLDTLAARRNEVWACTFAQAIQYHREKKSAVLTETSAPFANGDTWKLKLTDQLPDSLYFQPLTIKVLMPAGVTTILSISQSGKTLPFKINAGVLIFNAVPDGGEIIINISSCNVPVMNLHPVGTAAFCTPQKALLYADHTAGNTYEWSLDGVAISNSDNDSLWVSNTGKYDLKITNNGCYITSGILGQSIIVSNTGNCGEPRANFKIDRNPAVKLQVITATDLSQNVEKDASYLWSFGEEVTLSPSGTKASTFSGKGPISFKFLTGGVKTITLVVSGSVKNDTIKHEVTILEDAGCLLNETFDDNKMLSLIGGWNNYTFSVENSNLKVVVPATSPNEWYSFTPFFHENGIKKAADFSDITKKPIIKFRARASDTLTLKISLIDINGKVADGAVLSAKSKFDVTTEYRNFELNLTGLFFNQWDAVTLDSTKITAIDFRINSGYESYPFKNSFGKTINKSFVGTLEIDWLGANENCSAPPLVGVSDQTLSSQTLRVHPNPANNRLFIESDTELQEWTICGTSGQTLLKGKDQTADISSLSPGIYLLKVSHVVVKFIKQ